MREMSSISSSGEQLARCFRSIKDNDEAEIIVKAFFNLGLEQQGRFLSYLAGMMLAINYKEENK